MLNARHYLNLPSYPDQVGFRFYLAFFDSLYRHFLPGFLVDSQLNFTISTLTELLDDVEPVSKRNGIRIDSRARDVRHATTYYYLMVSRYVRCSKYLANARILLPPPPIV